MSNNVFERDLQPLKIEANKTIHSSDILPNTIEQRHIESNSFLTFFGLSANRPDGGSRVKSYFSTDTGVLSMWDGTQWLTTTLS